MTDHNALVREAQENHGTHYGQEDVCWSCMVEWPCLAARLADALGESQAALSAEVEQHCEYVTETTTAALRTAVALSSAEHRIAENEAGWADARALAARMQEAAEKRQQAVENMAARLAALERQHAASQERCSPENPGACGEDICDAMDREVARLARELGAARAALAKYGRHTQSCDLAFVSNPHGWLCSCGWSTQAPATEGEPA
jgi:hypothetical protein